MTIHNLSLSLLHFRSNTKTLKSVENKIDDTEKSMEADVEALSSILQIEKSATKFIIRERFSDIRTKIIEMKAQGKTEYEINLVIDDLILDCHRSVDRFIGKNRQYEIEKSDVIKTHRLFQEKVDELNFDFSPIEFEDESFTIGSAKTEFAHCVQALTPLSLIPGAQALMPLGVEVCLALNSEYLDQQQKKELHDFIPKALIGKHLTEFLAPFAALSKATDFILNGFYLANINEACQVIENNPRKISQCIDELRDSNKPLYKSVPGVKQLLKYLVRWDETLQRLDYKSQKEYRTIKGLVHEGCKGVTDVGLGMLPVGAVVKVSSRGITQAAKWAKRIPVQKASTPTVNKIGKLKKINSQSSSVVEIKPPKSPVGGSVQKQKYDGNSLDRYLKRAEGIRNFHELLEVEEKLLSILREKKSSLRLPVQDINQLSGLFSDHFQHSFKKSVLQGNLLLKAFDDSLLYFYRQNWGGKILLKTSSALSGLKKFEYVLEELFTLAKEKNFKKVWLGWNASRVTGACYLEMHGVNINSISFFEKNKALHAIAEIQVPNSGKILKEISLKPQEKIGNFLKEFASIIPLDPSQHGLEVVPDVVPVAKFVDNSMERIPLNIDWTKALDVVPEYGRGSNSYIVDFLKTNLKVPFSGVKTQSNLKRNFHHTVLDLEKKPIAFVKEFNEMNSLAAGFIPEIVSLSVIEELGLKQFSLPSVLARGKVFKDGQMRGLILYPYLQEPTFETVFRKGTEQPVQQIGQALGELNAVGHQFKASIEYLDGKIPSLLFYARSVLFYLKSNGFGSPITMKGVELIINDLKKNPGRAGLVHGDAIPQNIFCNNGKITLIDTGSLMESVTREGIPHGIPAMDQQQMIVSMSHLATKFGHQSEKLDSMIQAFLTGYELLPCISPEAERFARLYYEMQNLSHLFTQSQWSFIFPALGRIRDYFGQTGKGLLRHKQ